jgi:hypothetical protein
VLVLSKHALTVVAGGALIVFVAILIEYVASPMQPAPVASTSVVAKRPAIADEVVYAAPPPPPAETRTSTPLVPTRPDPSTIVSVEPPPRWSPGTVYAQASSLAVNGDALGARALLEPRVFGGGRATAEEVSLLRGICKSQRDNACTMAIAAKYY